MLPQGWGLLPEHFSWLTIFPVILAAFAISSNYYLALLFAFGLGVGFMINFTIINTLLQTRVEDSFRGRVMGLYTITFFGFAPFGNLLLGYLGQNIGLSISMAAFALCSMLLAGVIIEKTPTLKFLP